MINGGMITRNFAVLNSTAFMTQDASPNDYMNKTVWESSKNCPGTGVLWRLPSGAINPDNNVAIGINEIRYDYRLGQGGAGFDLMRADGY